MNDGLTLRSALSSLVSDGDAASPGLDALDPATVGQALFHFASAAPVALVARLGGLIDELDPLGAGSGPAELFSPSSITHHLDAFDAFDASDNNDLDDDDLDDDDGLHRVGPAGPDDAAQPSGDDGSDSDDDVDDKVTDGVDLDDEVAVSVYDSIYETEGELEQVGTRAHDAAASGDHHLDPKQGEVDDDTTDDWADDLDEAPQPAVISTWAADDDDDPFDDETIDLDDVNDV
jgi:hypothetical protein